MCIDTTSLLGIDPRDIPIGAPTHACVDRQSGKAGQFPVRHWPCDHHESKQRRLVLHGQFGRHDIPPRVGGFNQNSIGRSGTSSTRPVVLDNSPATVIMRRC
jgi:hypothetical protein